MAIGTHGLLLSRVLADRGTLEVLVDFGTVVARASPGFVAELVGAVVVVVEGSTMDSMDSEVPEAQLTEPPPTACQFEPMTWRSSTG